MYQPPEDLVCEQIITQLFPDNLGFKHPRCRVEPLNSEGESLKLISTTVKTMLPGRKQIDVLIRLIRKKEHESKRGVWVNGKASFKNDTYNIIFKDDQPILIPT